MKHKNDELTEELIKKNIITLTGEVNMGMVNHVRLAMVELITKGTPPCGVIITSGGGDVDAGLHIYDMLSCYPNKVSGAVVCEASSMAVIILQACTVRKAMQHSKILIHHISQKILPLDIMRNPKKLEEVCAHMEKSQRYINEILARRTKKTEEEIRIACEKDMPMTTEEAIAFGLLDEIVPRRVDATPAKGDEAKDKTKDQEKI